MATEPSDNVNDPTVYSIRRASDPLLPVKAATENVIILLSEQPKAFTKDHVDVTNATWVDPVALVAIRSEAIGTSESAVIELKPQITCLLRDVTIRCILMF